MSKWVIKKVQRITRKILEVHHFNSYSDAWEYWQKIRFNNTEEAFYTSPEREYS